ncbi:hypothetical protein ACHAPM_009848 [Fusarium culmorum]|uniref:Fucose-specific lectin n=1 Tax=Fusarium culmorum TaxID=5516 RepID=A0A2T4GQ17_FUSCU|nr:hypothetical protein FCULG_00000183 [Fusarium culmorum]
MSEAMVTPAENFARLTSPSLAVLNNALYIVWNNVSDNGTLRYTTWSDPAGKIANPMDVTAAGLSIRRQTSVALATFKDKLCLFFNGSGTNGTWTTTFSGSGWTQVNPVTMPLAGSALDYTSPAVGVSDGGRQLTLLWNGSANDGIWYTNTMDGTTWAPQMSISQMIGGQTVLYKSSPSIASYRGIPYVLWKPADNGWAAFVATFMAPNTALTPPAVISIFAVATLAVNAGFDVSVDVSEGTFSFRQPPPSA